MYIVKRESPAREIPQPTKHMRPLRYRRNPFRPGVGVSAALFIFALHSPTLSAPGCGAAGGEVADGGDEVRGAALWG